jgi:hypothetical protein
MIEQVLKYTYKDKLFNSQKEAINYAETLINLKLKECLDKLCVGPSAEIEITQFIIDNRKCFSNLFDY